MRRIFKSDRLKLRMKGKITGIYPPGVSTVYNYVCEGEEGLFNFAVEHRYHFDILEHEGDPVGREIDYIEGEGLRFLD